MKKYCIVGASGFAREAFCILEELGWKNEFLGFFQSDAHYEKGQVYGYDILPISQLDPALHRVVVAIGDSTIREKVVKELPEGIEYYKLIHPGVNTNKPNLVIGEGAIICEGSILTCDITIGKHCILNLSTTIGHDCVIGDYFTTTPAVNISGRCTMGDRVYFGTNAATRGVNTICSDVVIGMGGIVLKDIDEKGIYVGNPVKKIK